MKKRMQVLALSMFVISVLFFSPVTMSDVEPESIFTIDDSSLSATDYVPRDIRVAIYDEPNMTAPNYVSAPGGVNNNATGLSDVLVSYGYEVTLLDVHDIYDYKLTTADFDVLCLVDNFPRENITTRIMDFWLGGGGLLTFDGSGDFLCYFGILPPESLGTTGFSNYWAYISNGIIRHSSHPVINSLSVSVAISGNLAWDFIALQMTSIGGDLTKVASSGSDPDVATILAFDPSDRGGRVVTIASDLESGAEPELYQVYADAVEWLAPTPKARILYDLTHQPWVPTDTWEWAGDANYLTDYRDGLVSRSYTVDKLNPSAAGNLTTANLAPYDMLVTNQPLLSFSSQEILDVEAWVQAGGGLFVVGDNPGVPDNYNLDDLIAPYGIQFNDTVSPYVATVSNMELHPTTEDCSTLEYHGATNLVLSGDAYPIWSYAPGEAAAGGTEYGAGRVVVICDANSVADAWIVEASNYQFAMNVANWLTSSDADVLLFHNTGIPQYNHYRSAVADALNELGINFMHTYMPEYFNLSMNSRTWDMIIYDANSMSAVFNNERFFIQHLESGGKLIMRDFLFRHDTYPLWHYLGFQGCGSDERITTGAPSIYMWDEFHSVFNRPVDFAVDHFDSTRNEYPTDWTNATVLGNATAIAGITPTTEVNQSAILLGVDGQALCNMAAISQYHDDFDASGYPDNFELWLNEIAYMMRPTIESPGDLVIELAGPVSDFTWTPHSYSPGDYQIKRDSVIIATHVWDGSPITVDISGLSIGVYDYELMVRDHVGYRTDDFIEVTIEDTLAPVWVVAPTDQDLYLGEAFSQQLSADDPSGIGGWYVDDTTNFDITLSGLLTNNTNLAVGVYGLTVSVEDSLGHIRDFSVTIEVSLEPTPTTTSEPTPTPTPTPTGTPEPLDMTLVLIIAGAGGVLIIIIIIIFMKKK